MRKLYSLLATLLVAMLTYGQTYHSLSTSPLTQNWSNTNLITANDNWSNLPSIRGFRGDGLTSNTATNPQNTVADGSGTPLNVIANQSTPNTFATGGIAEFDGIPNPVVALQGSGTADAPHLVLYLNTTGVSNITVKYNVRDIDGSADNAVQQVALQYRVGTTGNFINIPAGYIADATTQGSASLVTNISVTLPSAAENQPNVQIRIITNDAPGSDEWIGIDDIEVTSNSSNSDITPPQISSVFPFDNSFNVPINATANIIFNETVQKGTGNIYVRRSSDNVAVQTIDVSTTGVVVAGDQATFSLTLSNSSSYYIQIDAGAFKDIANNSFAGLSDATSWNFTTVAPPANGILGKTYNFNTCSNYLNEGFKIYSVTGGQNWTCTKFGRTYVADPSSDSAIEMNGFSGTSQVNEDWLISPKFDLTGSSFPLLDFYSRSRFVGPSLSLKVSTNYSGTGNPALATWTTVFANFPAANSDVWALTDSINLSSFKTNNVHIAWVYTSTESAASRWTVDDITIYNSLIPPAPALVVFDRLLDFRYVAPGGVSEGKPISLYATNLTSPLTITAPNGFQISKDGNIYNSSVTYSVAEANNGQITPKVRFTPSIANTVYTGTIQFISSGITTTNVLLKGNSYPNDLTLNVVNWNIEWFGSPSNGPSNEALQLVNAKKVMDVLDADIYAVAEIVSPTAFGNLVTSLNQSYGYVIGSYCSGSTTNCSTSQKLAFAYKTDVVSNVKARPFMITSATARTNWASGRVPFLVTADVTKNGLSKTINFIVLHAKANTGTAAEQRESYFERKEGVRELKDSLDTYFANANVVILGDFNDDLDRTIAPTTGDDTVSSYQVLVADSTDENHYRSVTLPLSYAGLSSTAENPEVIDHVVISNELSPNYVNLSASLINDIGTVAGIADYANTTSDHYPILTRYVFCKPVCPADLVVSNDAGKCGAAVTFNLSGASACGTATSLPAPGSFFPLGNTTVEITTNYGEKCSFTVTVEDKEKPIITCKKEQIVNPTSLSGAVVNYELPAFSDNCGNPTIRQTAGLPSGETFPIGTTVNTFEVTDANGNVSSCSFAVTVRDPYCDNNKPEKKVYVCHNGNTNCVSVNALQAFLKKGGKLGRCEWYEAEILTRKAADEKFEVLDASSSLSLRTYPNPVNKAVQVTYTIPEAANVTIKLYDLAGREVGTIYRGQKLAGTYTIEYATSSLGKGVYYCRINASGKQKEWIQTQKLIKAN